VVLVASGEKTYGFEPVSGIWRRLEGPEEVLELMDSGADGVVAVVRDAGATFLSPIFDELAGVVCTGGTIRSHIGIVSREFRVPGIVGAEILNEPADDTHVELDGTGEVGIVRVVGGG
jgi:signal transduction protein with GAF and PtsI domain